jgi:cytochrome c-type biogenesis protein CcmH
MLFWVIVIGLALVSGGILAFYTLKGRVGAEPPAAYDLRIYRDQLKEVDRDLARGVIGEEDAERLRTEVSRRILAADARLKAGGETGGQPRAAGYAMAALAVLGVGAARSGFMISSARRAMTTFRNKCASWPPTRRAPTG